MSVEQVLAKLPADRFLSATIRLIGGDEPWHELLIVEPAGAADAGMPEVTEFGDLPCVALRPIETLEPMYAGYPGTVWPVAEVSAAGDLVELSGPQGTATLRRLPHDRLASLCGRADRLQDWYSSSKNSATSEDLEPVRLPINRKERYYTGTVLPMIVAAQGFRELHRLLSVAAAASGLDKAQFGPTALNHEDGSRIQFFTEYSFAESVFTGDDHNRFRRRPVNADTPDLVILGAEWLLAIEAKMFHRPSAVSLDAQYQRQVPLVRYWTERFGIDSSRAMHVLLLPAQLAAAVEGDNGVAAPIMTWEQVLQQFRNVGEAYWIRTLAGALNRYADLASKDATWGKHAQTRLTGAQIVAAHQAADPSVTWMGRRGGLNGPETTGDLASGSWLTRMYEVRDAPVPSSSKNWFLVEAFVALLEPPSE